MSNQHKHPTISFRISDAERKQIEARILASGMMKKDYFVRSCIYNRICVVGKKEAIYPLVQTVNALYKVIPTSYISAAHFFKNCFLHFLFHLSHRPLSIDFFFAVCFGCCLLSC